jgi:hypothetical protein
VAELIDDVLATVQPLGSRQRQFTEPGHVP